MRHWDISNCHFIYSLYDEHAPSMICARNDGYLKSESFDGIVPLILGPMSIGSPSTQRIAPHHIVNRSRVGTSNYANRV